MADTVETLPMSILSGQYQQNFYKGTPMADLLTLQRQVQPGRDVAAARLGVADKNLAQRTDKNQQSYNTATEAADSQITTELASVEARISELDKSIKELEATEKQDQLEYQGLQDIMTNKRGVPSDVSLPVVSGQASSGSPTLEIK